MTRAQAAAKKTRLTDVLRVPRKGVDLSAVDTRSTPGFDGDKVQGKQALVDMEPVLSELQEKLYAEGRAGGERRLLLVLQGMDTSGKGGVMRHSVALFDPQGVHIKAFGPPTRAERRHDFLWRIRRELPEGGRIGIFDRSHYEDVLIGRVRGLAPEAEIEKRYDAINAFEAETVHAGTTVVKCMLHISPEEQKARLLSRLDDPTKHWKYNPGDIEERRLWDDYQAAYEIALGRCDSDAAPWLVVPSDRKWYRNWAVGKILRETLERLDPQWPEADFDVKEQRRLLSEEPSAG